MVPNVAANTTVSRIAEKSVEINIKIIFLLSFLLLLANGVQKETYDRSAVTTG